MVKTSFFRSCLGVFQGGGCRAAAFVGAYEEAIKSGVSFAEVAGTSAGSIVASLVGAGATPKDLRSAIGGMDFKSFQGGVERTRIRSLPGWILSLKYPQLANLIYDQGFYSSAPVRDWLNDQLVRLLPREKHPLAFHSLPFPTYIVSTDLSRSEAKIWSQKTTPNDLVADAVQASCAIPIFFQPVNRRYVDGGLLSNLPGFVFSDGDYSDRSLASRVLAFALVADEPDHIDWGTERFLRLLANAVVDGGQHLQLALQPQVHLIKIPTGQIRATDFEKMTPDSVESLISNGARATREFIEGELLHVHPSTDETSICHGTDEVYARVAESLELPLERVVIAEQNTDWVYSLFPTLLCWRARNVAVDVILPGATSKADEPYRRRLLRAMGARVRELPPSSVIPPVSYVIVPKDPARLRAIVGVEKQSHSQTIAAVLYDGFLDEAVIRAVLGQLDDLLDRPGARETQPPRLQFGGQEALITRITSVSQYSRAGVKVSIEDVPIAQLVSLTRFVREYKYKQIGHFMDVYKESNIPLFEPCSVTLETAETSIVTPPVVEESGGQFVLIEGSTRATYCRDEGVSQIKCVVVRGVTEALPSQPVPFKQVRVVGRTLEAAQRYEHFNYSHFRSIERAVHPLDSLKD